MWRKLSPYPQIILMLLIALTIFILWPVVGFPIGKNLAAPGSTSAVKITSIQQLDCNIHPCRGELSGQYQIEVIVRPTNKTIPKNRRECPLRPIEQSGRAIVYSYEPARVFNLGAAGDKIVPGQLGKGYVVLVHSFPANSSC